MGIHTAWAELGNGNEAGTRNVARHRIAHGSIHGARDGK